MPSIMFIEARNAKASASGEHAGTASHGKAAFSAMAAHISSHRHCRAGTSSQATAAFSATHALQPCLMFGASASMRHAIGRSAHAQSGRLSFGSLLTNLLRQSATRHRQVGRPSFGGQRTEIALPRSTSVRQNLWKSIPGSAAVHKPNISIHGRFGVFSSALASVTSLTGQSRGHQRAAHVGAPYFGR